MDSGKLVIQAFIGRKRTKLGAAAHFLDPQRQLCNDLGGRIANPTSHLSRVLIVEPDALQRWKLQRILEAQARVETCSTFQEARRCLLEGAPDLLVTNIRLNAYNGLHLVYLSKLPTRAVVYMNPPDPVVLRDAQRGHAFVESVVRLPVALRSYVRAALPDHDRRGVFVPDRRLTPRGGRRAPDRVLLPNAP